MSTRTISGLEALLAELGLVTPIPKYFGAETLLRPIDIYRSYLADSASNALDCDTALVYEAVQNANTKDNGDLALILPKLKLKAKGKPKDLATESLQRFSLTPLFLLPLHDGVHLRFFFFPKTLPQIVLPYIGDRMQDYGIDNTSGLRNASTSDAERRKVVVEFSSPNLASEFNGAHLRSTLIGAQLSNLYERHGWDVVRLNYLGDWGKQLGLLAAGWHRFGNKEVFEKDPMSHLLDVYQRIDELFKPEKEASKKARDDGQGTAAIESQGIFAERDGFFKRMEEAETEALDLWKRFRDVSIDYYANAYARLGIKFDDYSGESQNSPESIVEVESALKGKGIYEESEGSWIIDYKKHGPKNLGTAILRGRMGSTTYLLRDVAAVLDREKKYSFDKMIYVVSSEQDSHFHRVFQTLKFLGRDDLVERVEHVNFGKVQGMSPQLGKVHLLGDILDQTLSAIHGLLRDQPAHIENTEATANALNISALIAEDGFVRRATGYNFSMKKLASFDGETGPRLQASYVKLCARIIEMAAEDAQLADIDYTHIQDEPWTDVLRVMAQYPDVTCAAFKAHEPSMIVSYLFRLIEELENCLEEDEDEDEDEGGEGTSDPPEAILAQGVLLRHARQVLENGMSILGITPIKG